MKKAIVHGGGLALAGAIQVLMLALFIASAVSGFMFLFYTGRFMDLLLSWMPFIQGAAGAVLMVGVLVGLPTLAFQKTAAISALAFQAVVWVFSISIGLTSLLIIYQLWGRLAAILSVALLPFLPLVAAVGLGIAGEWTTIGSLLMSATIWGLAVAGAAFASRRHDRQR